MNISDIAPKIARTVAPRLDKFRRRSGRSFIDKIDGKVLAKSALVASVLVSGALAVVAVLRRTTALTKQKQVEKVHDKTLKDSFPASDPPASQYFDIPVNRQ